MTMHDCRRDPTTPLGGIEPLEPLEPFPEYAERRKREFYGSDYGKRELITTCDVGPITRTRWFHDSTTDKLRRMLQPIVADVGRAQLMALCLNRWPCGYWIECEAPEEGSDGRLQVPTVPTP